MISQPIFSLCCPDTFPDLISQTRSAARSMSNIGIPGFQQCIGPTLQPKRKTAPKIILFSRHITSFHRKGLDKRNQVKQRRLVFNNKNSGPLNLKSGSVGFPTGNRCAIRLIQNFQKITCRLQISRSFCQELWAEYPFIIF